MRNRMNRLVWLLPVVNLMLAWMSATQSASAAGLNWSTMDGGGTTCYGGLTVAGETKFTLTGTVGQPDTSAVVGGAMTLQSGFLPAFTLSTTPTLLMQRSGNAFTFIWPAACTGFVLETSSNINAPVWSPLSDGALLGVNRVVTIARPPSPMFFRLRKDCPR